MTRLVLAPPFALAALAPADTVRAGAGGPVAKSVTFRLAPGVTEPAVLDAASIEMRHQALLWTTEAP